MMTFWLWWDRLTRPVIPAVLGFLLGCVFAIEILGRVLGAALLKEMRS